MGVGWRMFKSAEYVSQEEGKMTKNQQLTAGIAAVVLVGVYSWIMTASEGTIASWAWLLLIVAAALLVVTARSVAKDRTGRDDA
jgi:preprotein translocase subunit SecD